MQPFGQSNPFYTSYPAHPRFTSASTPSHSTWFKLPAHSSVFIDKQLEDGDKVILPPSVLTAVMQRYGNHMPQPLIFEINNNAVSRTSHCGVLEFSAPDETVYLPHWMMQNLALQEGREVRLRVKSLSKATEVRLQPVEFAFTQLHTPRESMEWALRKFTALTVGDEVPMTAGDGRVYHMRVLALQPITCSPHAGCVVNTSLAVDFAEPAQAPRKGEGDGEEMKEGERQDGEVEAESYHYYRFKLEDRQRGVKVECVATAGSPDVYVSTQHGKPSIAQHEFKTSLLQPTIVIPPPAEPAARSASPVASPSSGPAPPSSSSSTPSASVWYYISVHAYKQPASYSLLITTFAPAASSALASAIAASSTAVNTAASSSPTSSFPSGVTLGSSSSPSPTPSSASAPSDSTWCGNCHLYIPSKQYTLHSIQCPRLVSFCSDCNRAIRRSDFASHAHCPTCRVALHRDELQKHIDLLHGASRCSACGQQVTGEEMPQHLANDCPLRLLPCAYCNMRLPARDLPEHLQYEAAKSINCERCGAAVSRKKMNNHLAAVHNINPSLRAGDRSSMGRALSTAASAAAAAASSAPTSAPARRVPAADAGTDAVLQRVLRESRRSAGLSADDSASAEDGDDAVLQRVLRQSELDAQGAAAAAMTASQDSDHLTAEEADEDDISDIVGVDEADDVDVEDWAEDSGSVAAAAVEPSELRSSGEAHQQQPMQQDSADQNGEREEPARQGAGGSVAPVPSASETALAVAAEHARTSRREPSMCPYCAAELPDYESLIEHMAVCDQMED